MGDLCLTIEKRRRLRQEGSKREGSIPEHEASVAQSVSVFSAYALYPEAACTSNLYILLHLHSTAPVRE